MTRSSLSRRLLMIYLLCGLVLALSFAARVAKFIPGLDGTILVTLAPLIYDYLRDMALVFVTMVAAYLAHVFQKRTKFVASLEEEWRSMVATKTKLIEFCDRGEPSLDEYLRAYGRISATLDNMRIVYRNVGETDELIGFYPYSPLHDMRRALESLDPRQAEPITSEHRSIACAAIQRSFTALRETFLEELDLEEPVHGQLVSGARRIKRPGATRSARRRQDRQLRRLAKRTAHSPDDPVTTLLASAYKREQEREAAASLRKPMTAR